MKSTLLSANAFVRSRWNRLARRYRIHAALNIPIGLFSSASFVLQVSSICHLSRACLSKNLSRLVALVRRSADSIGWAAVVGRPKLPFPLAYDILHGGI